MQMLTTAKRLDWYGWIVGVFGAAVSGGAGSIGSGFGSVLIDPKDFNIAQGGIHHLLSLMGITFCFSAIISLAKFLQTHPVPDPAPQEVVANVKTEMTITPTDPSKPETKITSSTPVTGPAPTEPKP